MGKDRRRGGEAMSIPLFLILPFSFFFFPIFLSGVGIGVSVLGLGVWGFSLLPFFFDTEVKLDFNEQE